MTFRVAIALLLIAVLPPLIHAELIVENSPPKPFSLIGFASVDKAHPETLIVETGTAIYHLDRVAVLNANKQYLSKLNAKNQVVLKVEGRMVKKVELHKIATVEK